MASQFTWILILRITSCYLSHTFIIIIIIHMYNVINMIHTWYIYTYNMNDNYIQVEITTTKTATEN